MSVLIQHRVEETDASAFFNVLTGSQLLDGVEALLPAQRERLFPPTETLPIFLAQVLSADGGCQQAVDEAVIKRIIGGLPRCAASLGFPICRMVALICLGSGALLDAATGPCEGQCGLRGSDEQTLLRGMLNALEADAILLGDAFYPTYIRITAMPSRLS